MSGVFRVWSGSGVTQFALNTAYSQGDRIVPLITDTGTNYENGRSFVWECTAAGTTDAALQPSWPLTVTADVTTVTSNTATFTARNIGYSSGSTVSWNFATPILLYPMATATYGAASSFSCIYVHYTHQEEQSADRTYTALGDFQIYVVDKDNNEAHINMGTSGWVGNSTTNRGIIFAGSYENYIKNLTLRTAGATADSITLISSDGQAIEYDGCYFWHGNTATTSTITIGTSAEQRGYARILNSTFRFGHVSQSIAIGDTKVEIIGGSLSADGKIPTTLFTGLEQGPDVYIEGMDLSAMTTGKTLVADHTGGSRTFNFVNCEIGAATPLATQTTKNYGSATVNLYNCGGKNVHYGFASYSAHGSTVAQTYCTFKNNPARYDGTMPVAWRVVTNAAGSGSTSNPYRTPWVDVYHDSSTAISPYFEVLRVGSTSSFDRAFLWLELQYHATMDSPVSTFVSSRIPTYYTGTEWVAVTDNVAGAGTSAWNLETLQMQGYSSFKSLKLTVPSPITPKAIGYIRARVCVAATVVTDFVINPYILGLT